MLIHKYSFLLCITGRVRFGREGVQQNLGREQIDAGQIRDLHFGQRRRENCHQNPAQCRGQCDLIKQDQEMSNSCVLSIYILPPPPCPERISRYQQTFGPTLKEI